MDDPLKASKRASQAGRYEQRTVKCAHPPSHAQADRERRPIGRLHRAADALAEGVGSVAQNGAMEEGENTRSFKLQMLEDAEAHQIWYNT
jgi:hypothetical protein